MKKKKVEFEITEDMLKFWNRELKYVTEKGEFKVYIGGNSRDCLEEKFSLM